MGTSVSFLGGKAAGA